MRIYLAQVNPVVGDLAGNANKIIHEIESAKNQSADCILFSELVLCGYPPEDFLLMPHFVKEAERKLQEIALVTDRITAIVGTIRGNPTGKEKELFNSAAVLSNGKLVGFQDKMLLPTYDVFDERRYFEPGKEKRVWTIAGKKVGITICEDVWQHADVLQYSDYAIDPVKELSALKPDLVVNLSASPYSTTHFKDRLQVCSQAAKTLNCPFIYCNQVGANDSLIFDGYSFCMDDQGAPVAIAKGFEEDRLVVDLPLKQQPLTLPDQSLSDLYKALVLGVRDYFSKLGFQKACLGLSGGIDSALVACIAVEALGRENVLAIGMPSRYTSKESHTDADELVKNLGIAYQEISIEGPFKSYLELLEPYFKDKKPDITEENLQARVRGMILMAFSNKYGYIVLNTGNKSELAVGYSTLYGDMCGGLAVINDVTKMQVYALANWINRNQEIIPKNMIRKAPSAELRHNQKDSDSLPDYQIIDTILEAYVEDHRSPVDIAAQLNYPLSLVEDIVKKIHHNEFKRRQSPPGLRVTDKAFTIGRRFPIVQKWI